MSKPSRRKQIMARLEAREKLRADLIAWLAWANSVLVALQVDAQEMRETLYEGRSPAALAQFLTRDEAAGIEGALEEAVSRVLSVVVPALDFKKPDALGWNEAASATID